jgi:hypothetical protein
MMANPHTHASTSTHLAVNPHYSPHNPHELPRTHSSPIPHQGSSHYTPSDSQERMYSPSQSSTYYAYGSASNPGSPPHNHARSSNPPHVNLSAAMLHRRGTSVGISSGNAPSGSRSKISTTRGQEKQPGSNVFYDFSHVATTNSISNAGKHMLNQYYIIRRVGKGQHGYVFEAEDSINNRTVVSGRVSYAPMQYSSLRSPSRLSNRVNARTRNLSSSVFVVITTTVHTPPMAVMVFRDNRPLEKSKRTTRYRKRSARFCTRSQL